MSLSSLNYLKRQIIPQLKLDKFNMELSHLLPDNSVNLLKLQYGVSI